MADELCLQLKYAPKSICYGCGPANPDGLHISSFPQEDGSLLAEWAPDLRYQAFPGMVYGGLVCCLLDCHANWTASWHLMQQNGLDAPPCTVTAEHNVKFKRPTPSDATIRVITRVVESKDDRATIYGELIAHDKVCATCHSTFVAVKEGHPAYHRW
jgi:hypothetical protein